MWLDVLVLILLCAFGWTGARRGGAVSAMGVATLVTSYGAAIVSGKAFGPALATGLGLPEIAGIPLAGSLAFFVVLVLMGLLTRVVRNFYQEREKSPRDRFLGAAFGALRGAFIALLISYLAIWVDAMRLSGMDAIPELGSSAAANMAETLVMAGVESALSDVGPASRVVARIAGRPGATLADLRDVMENPHMENLQGDESFWVYVEAGAIDAALNQRSFLDLSRDETFRYQLASLGLIEAEAASDWHSFREAAHEILEQVGPRIRGLRNHPELNALLEDPEVVAMVDSRDTIGLMGHPGFRSLVTQVVSAPVDPR